MLRFVPCSGSGAAGGVEGRVMGEEEEERVPETSDVYRIAVVGEVVFNDFLAVVSLSPV